MFTDQELAYLREQPLVRIATVAQDGQPTVDVVGFQFDGARFSIGGHQVEATRKYRNVAAGNRKVSLIVDDLKSRDPWRPRGIRVHGVAELAERQEGHLGPGMYLVITPTVSWSWGILPMEAGRGPGAPHKIVWQ